MLSPLVIGILVVLAVISLTIGGASLVDVFCRKYQIETREDFKEFLKSAFLPKHRYIFADLRAQHPDQPRAADLAQQIASAQQDTGDGGLTLAEQIRKRQEEGEAEEDDGIKDNALGWLARHKNFEMTTMAVITLNALMLGWDADYTARFQKPLVNVLGIEYEGPWYFVMIEYIFATYFTFEILVRFWSYKRLVYCCNAWFVFDSVLVTMMVFDTWILPFAGLGGALSQLSALRLVRLVRVTRLVRLMRAFPEMMMIIKGMAAAVRSVFWTGILMTILVFTFSIMFTNEFHQGPIEDADVEEDIHFYFGSMGKCMLTLFILGSILDDVTAACDAIRATGNTPMLGVFIVFIVISSFMMLNLLVGIMAEVVTNTAEEEKAERQQDEIKDAIISAISKLDDDKSGMVSKKEYLAIKEDAEFAAALETLEIKEKHFMMFAGVKFGDGSEDAPEVELSVEQVIDLILRLRPDNSMKKLDFAAMASEMLSKRSVLEQSIETIERQVEEVMRLRGFAPPPLVGPTLAHRGIKSQSTMSSKAESPDKDVKLRTAGTGDSPPAPIVAGFTADPRFTGLDDELIVAELERRLRTGEDGRCLTTGTMQSASIVEVTDVEEELYDVETTSSDGMRDPFHGSRLSSDDFEEMSC